MSTEEATNFYDYTPQTDPQVQRAVSAAQQLSGTTTLAGASSAAAADSAASSAAADDTTPQKLRRESPPRARLLRLSRKRLQAQRSEPADLNHNTKKAAAFCNSLFLRKELTLCRN